MDRAHRSLLKSIVDQLHILRNLEAEILEVGPDARERKMLAENIYEIDQAASLLNRTMNR